MFDFAAVMAKLLPEYCKFGTIFYVMNICATSFTVPLTLAPQQKLEVFATASSPIQFNVCYM